MTTGHCGSAGRCPPHVPSRQAFLLQLTLSHHSLELLFPCGWGLPWATLWASQAGGWGAILCSTVCHTWLPGHKPGSSGFWPSPSHPYLSVGVKHCAQRHPPGPSTGLQLPPFPTSVSAKVPLSWGVHAAAPGNLLCQESASHFPSSPAGTFPCPVSSFCPKYRQ